MIRFKNGVPDLVWFSQHANGEAFKYSILEKQGLRVSRQPFLSLPPTIAIALFSLAAMIFQSWLTLL